MTTKTVTKTDTTEKGFRCGACKKNGVFPDSNGYCTKCGVDQFTLLEKKLYNK